MYRSAAFLVQRGASARQFGAARRFAPASATAILLAIACLTAGCSSEPSEPREAYLWQLDQKIQTLLAHLASPDDVVTVDAAALSDMGILSDSARVYRFMQVPSAAEAVIEHIALPPLPAIQAIAQRPEGSDWAARFEAAIVNGRQQLAEHVERFKAAMPENPESLEQDSAIGELLIGGCERGSIYSASEACPQNQYRLSEDGDLFFYVWRNRQMQQLMVERILDIDVQDWLSSIDDTAARITP